MKTDQRAPLRDSNTFQEHTGDQASSPAAATAGMDQDRKANGKAHTRSFHQQPSGKFVVAKCIYRYDGWAHDCFVQSAEDAYLQADKVPAKTEAQAASLAHSQAQRAAEVAQSYVNLHRAGQR